MTSEQLPVLSAKVTSTYGTAITDADALAQIQRILQDPEWNSAMLEDIRALVERTGRSCDNVIEEFTPQDAAELERLRAEYDIGRPDWPEIGAQIDALEAKRDGEPISTWDRH